MILRLEKVGPIVDAQLQFGNLTVLVGPQASGKSIALQMLKLVIDTGYVQEIMRRHGLDWSGNLRDFINAYFGEGMHSIWSDASSRVTCDSKEIDLPRLVARQRRIKTESLFFIPAQRVLALRDGWPRPFTDFSPGDPFIVRDFSEKLRLLVEQEFRAPELFPQERRLKREFRDMLERTLFGRFHLSVDKARSQKRLVLDVNGNSLPFMVWSAGQREFVPLLLGMYWLMPPTKVSRRGRIEWVVVEELEMGLHPRAIAVVMLLVFELIRRGYRVCISTHSPQILDAVWALKYLKDHAARPAVLLKVFDAPCTPQMQSMAEAALRMTTRVFYFDGATGRAKDISDLDPDSEEIGAGGWGGLTEFSARANAAVAQVVANT